MSYRVKLHNGRAVGPFSKEEIGQLLLKGHIDGKEKYQVFPNGKWLDLKNYNELKNFLVKVLEQKPNIKIKPDQGSEVKAESLTQFKEFKFQIENDEVPRKPDETKKEIDRPLEIEDEEEDEGPPELDKTVVRNIKKVPVIEKTRIVRLNDVKDEEKKVEIGAFNPVKTQPLKPITPLFK